MVQKYKRNATFEEIKCLFADKGDYIEITEWDNGDGVDIDIYFKGDVTRLQLTCGQVDSILNCLKGVLDYNERINDMNYTLAKD